MRILGYEPSSVILGQTKKFKSWKRWTESAKTSWSQKGWCNKPIKLQFEIWNLYNTTLLQRASTGSNNHPNHIDR